MYTSYPAALSLPPPISLVHNDFHETLALIPRTTNPKSKPIQYCPITMTGLVLTAVRGLVTFCRFIYMWSVSTRLEPVGLNNTVLGVSHQVRTVKLAAARLSSLRGFS